MDNNIIIQPNGWNEWSKFVLKELERLNSCYDAIDKKVDKINVELAMLKVKSGIWGATAGIVGSLAILLFQLIK